MIADRLRLLAFVLGGLALVLLLEWVWPEGYAAGAGRLGTVHHMMQAAPKAGLQARAADEWAATVLARPLFSIARRPAREAAPNGPTAAPDQARLAGILIGRFGRRAIFAPEGGGKALVLGEGAAINESTIRTIQPNEVVLASGVVLTPSFDRNRVAAAPFVPGFQPIMPNFQPPGFPNGQMPQAGFPLQRSVMPTPPSDGDAPPDVPPSPAVPVPGLTTPVPIFRGSVIPQRRE